MTSTTTRKHPDALRVLKAHADELVQREIHVGWGTSMGAPAETVTIAAFNILGTATIPARDALTPAVTGSLGTINEHNRRAVHALNEGKSADPELTLLALELQDALQQSVLDFSTPGNADSTIAQKGRDWPLKGATNPTDPGRIYDSARARVVKL